MKADVAVFDAATVKDLATFEHPHQYATGMHFVIVNGQLVGAIGVSGAATAEQDEEIATAGAHALETGHGQ